MKPIRIGTINYNDLINDLASRMWNETLIGRDKIQFQ